MRLIGLVVWWVARFAFLAVNAVVFGAVLMAVFFALSKLLKLLALVA